MRKILITTDLSANAQNAANYGVALLDSAETVFVFLNTFYVQHATDDSFFQYSETVKAEAEESLQKEIERIKKEYPELKSQMEYHFEIGEITDVANSFVHREGISYMLMGTKGASGLTEFLVGSRTASMIKKVSCPLIIVPEQAKYRGLEKILFTTDKELQNEDLDLELLKELAQKNQSSIQGLYISKTGENLDVDATFIRYDLDIQFEDIKHHLDVDINSDPTEAIETYLHKHPVDLVAMISTKGNLFYQLFHKSVTKSVAMHTQTPMLILHTKI